MRAFEDFPTGSSGLCGTKTLSEGEIIAFAREFDPQPMHLDGASEQAQSVGGLIGSGWHTCALTMRMMADGFILGSTGMGSPGVESVKWLRPVRPGDSLTCRYTVLGRRASTSKPDRGFVQFRIDVTNQRDETVFEQVNLVMFGRREPGLTVPDDLATSTPPPVEVLIRVPESDNPELARVGALNPGLTVNLGRYTFTPERIISFAKAYDPQAFHLSEEAGRASHFGGLSASGWHTASAWMASLIAYRAREAEAGRFVPKLGPSPGFRDLIWRKPVLAGDTLTYFSRIIEARKSASRPGWGMVNHRNYALNQKGELVFAFTGSVLWEAEA